MAFPGSSHHTTQCHFLHFRTTHFITLLLPYLNNLLILNNAPTTVKHICIKQFHFIHSSYSKVKIYLTLLWYHEKSYVNSTMGSYWLHCKKNQNKSTFYYNVFFFPNNILQHRFVRKYRQTDTTFLGTFEYIGYIEAVVPWGLCDPSPLWLTFFFNCHE